MVMVFIKTTSAASLLLIVFLCAAWFSSARLHHPLGAQVDGISSPKVNVVTATINSYKEKNLDAIEGNLKKLSVKQITKKSGGGSSSRSTLNGKNISRTQFSNEVGGGFMTFAADYHSPRHHPPKNNK